jgi:predicted lipoprotein with Yx(FWY)xxD motif
MKPSFITAILTLATFSPGFAQSAPLVLGVQTDLKLGSFLTGQGGLTLYIFTKDSRNKSVCEGACADLWPPLLSSSGVRLPSGAAGRVTTFTRSDGKRQVAYNGQPLYYWKNDLKAGEVSGQGVSNVWYTANLGPTLQVGRNEKLGSFLTGPNGKTLYLFTKDEAGKSNCEGPCLAIWPPLLVSRQPEVSAALSNKVSTLKRPDGSLQVTFDGKPLYYFAKDIKEGDINGQGVNNVWYVLKP